MQPTHFKIFLLNNTLPAIWSKTLCLFLAIQLKTITFATVKVYVKNDKKSVFPKFPNGISLGKWWKVLEFSGEAPVLSRDRWLPSTPSRRPE